MLNKNLIIETSFEQGDKLWHDARIDSIGGTGVSKIITNVKAERSKSREGYLLEKAGDIISRDPEPTYQNWSMRWGHKYESIAREVFEMVEGVEVKTCAMIFSDDKKNWHISPDFHRDDLRWGGEIKCYQLKAFKKCVEDNKLPSKHILQIQTGLALTGWDFWWFVAYFPSLRPFIIKIERDESLIKIIKAEVNIFLRELNILTERLRRE